MDTEGVPETTRAVEVTNVTREDGVALDPVREEILNQAPLREGDFFRFPESWRNDQRLRGRLGWVFDRDAIDKTQPAPLQLAIGHKASGAAHLAATLRWLRTPTRMS